jgi:hypothetical protein
MTNPMKRLQNEAREAAAQSAPPPGYCTALKQNLSPRQYLVTPALKISVAG